MYRPAYSKAILVTITRKFHKLQRNIELQSNYAAFLVEVLKPPTVNFEN